MSKIIVSGFDSREPSTLQDHVDRIMGHPRTQPIQTMRDDKGKLRRRCESISPMHGLQCEKRRKHVKTEGKPVHMNGSVLWGPGNPGVKTLTEALRAAMRTERQRPDQGQVVSIDFKVPGSKDRIDLSSFAKKVGGLDDGKLSVSFDNPCDGTCQQSPSANCPSSRRGNEPGFTVLDETHTFSSAPGMAPAVETPDLPTLDLESWWSATAEDEIARTVPKVREYGATDLRDTGHVLARTMGREVDEEEAIELGIFFYLVGKLSRWQSAVERGDRPSDDTLFDIGVYVRMAQRTRYAGTFPGPVPDEGIDAVPPEGLSASTGGLATGGDVPPSRLLTENLWPFGGIR